MTEGHVAEDDEDIFWKVLRAEEPSSRPVFLRRRRCGSVLTRPLTTARSHGWRGLGSALWSLLDLLPVVGAVLPAVVNHPRLVHLHLGAAAPVRGVPHPSARQWSRQAGVVRQGQVVFAAIEGAREVR